MATYVIGDVHGCGLELILLLEKLKVRRGLDQVFLVGDLFDRGFHGHLVWFAIQDYGLVCVQGNHERKLGKLIKGSKEYFPPHYYWTLRNLESHGIARAEIAKFIEGMPKLIVFEALKTIITHGGVLINDPTKEDVSANTYGSFDQNQPMPRPRVGDGKQYWWDQYEGEYKVVYGHIVTESCEPRVRPNSVGIDTAAVHGGCLTAYCIEEDSFVSVPALKDWWGKMQEDSVFQSFKSAPVLVK